MENHTEEESVIRLPWWGRSKGQNITETNSGRQSPISPIWSDLSGHHKETKHTVLQPIALTAKSRVSKCTIWLVVISLLLAAIGITVGAVGIVRWQALKKEVDRLHGEVDHFASLNKDLERTNEDLKNTNLALETQVQRLDVEITKFSELSESIRKFVNESSVAFDVVLDQANALFANISSRLTQMDAINQATHQALELQLESEKRERYTAYVSMAATTELADGRPGFTPSEWDIFADRATRVQANTPADAATAKADFLQQFPFATLANGGATIPYEAVFTGVIPNLLGS